MGYLPYQLVQNFLDQLYWDLSESWQFNVFTLLWFEWVLISVCIIPFTFRHDLKECRSIAVIRGSRAMLQFSLQCCWDWHKPCSKPVCSGGSSGEEKGRGDAVLVRSTFCERNCPPCCWPDRPRGHRSWHSTSSQLCLNLAVVLCDRLAAWHHPHLNFLTAHLIISYTFIVTGRIRSETWKRDEGGGQSAGHWGAESVGLVCVKFVNSEIVWAFLLGM